MRDRGWRTQDPQLETPHIKLWTVSSQHWAINPDPKKNWGKRTENHDAWPGAGKILGMRIDSYRGHEKSSNLLSRSFSDAFQRAGKQWSEFRIGDNAQHYSRLASPGTLC
jgi:hypothetical protein